MGYAESIFAEDDHRNRNFIGASEFLDGLAFTFRNGRKSVRVQNQAHSSGSIFSNSLSINRLMCAVSLRKWLKAPASFFRAFSPLPGFAASFSATASLTNCRR